MNGFGIIVRTQEDAEETREQQANFLQEPANAVSNVVFMLVGVYAFLCAVYDFRHFRRRSFPVLKAGGRQQGGLADSPVLSLAYAFSMAFGGYGSFIYHACSNCSEGGQLDIWSIFVLCGAVVWLLLVFSYLGLCCGTYMEGRRGRCAAQAICLALWSWTSWVTQDWNEPPIWQGSWQKMYRLMMISLGCVAGVSSCSCSSSSR